MFLGTDVHYFEWTVVIAQNFVVTFFLNSRLGIVVCTKYLEKQKWWVFIGIARVIVWRKSIQWLYIKNKRKKPTRGSCTFQFWRLIVWIRTSQTKLIFTVATSNCVWLSTAISWFKIHRQNFGVRAMAAHEKKGIQIIDDDDADANDCEWLIYYIFISKYDDHREHQAFNIVNICNGSDEYIHR